MNKKIVICGTCKGEGTVEIADQNLYNVIDKHLATCSSCGGTGRMVEVSWIRLVNFSDYEKNYESLGTICTPRPADRDSV